MVARVIMLTIIALLTATEAGGRVVLYKPFQSQPQAVNVYHTTAYSAYAGPNINDSRNIHPQPNIAVSSSAVVSHRSAQPGPRPHHLRQQLGTRTAVQSRPTDLLLNTSNWGTQPGQARTEDSVHAQGNGNRQAVDRKTTLANVVSSRSTTTRRLMNATNSNSTAVDCAKYNFTDTANGTLTPRVFDCFIMNTELDMAEIRLRELEHVVDVFVVLESRMTFRGGRRPLHFPRVMHRLPATVIAKLKYVVLDSLDGKDAWAKEEYQRNAMFTIGLKEAQPQPGDIIIASDCDEIPKPSFVSALKHCNGAQYPLSMQTTLRYYSFDLVAANGEQWKQPRATTFSDPFSITSQQLRFVEAKATYPDTSWHCSWCFSSVSAMQNKLSSFSHAELDTAGNHDPESIVAKVRAGIAVFQDLAHHKAVFVSDAQADMPAFVAAHPTRFAYLLSRDTADAGFLDLDKLD